MLLYRLGSNRRRNQVLTRLRASYDSLWLKCSMNYNPAFHVITKRLFFFSVSIYLLFSYTLLFIFLVHRQSFHSNLTLWLLVSDVPTSSIWALHAFASSIIVSVSSSSIPTLQISPLLPCRLRSNPTLRRASDILTLIRDEHKRLRRDRDKVTAGYHHTIPPSLISWGRNTGGIGLRSWTHFLLLCADSLLFILFLHFYVFQ